MNRLDNCLKHLKAENSKGLVAYLVAGDPSIQSTLELMHGFVQSGVDIIELGIPFSDPIAEGITIQNAHDRALKNGTTFSLAFKLLQDFRKEIGRAHV